MQPQLNVLNSYSCQNMRDSEQWPATPHRGLLHPCHLAPKSEVPCPCSTNWADTVDLCSLADDITTVFTFSTVLCPVNQMDSHVWNKDSFREFYCVMFPVLRHYWANFLIIHITLHFWIKNPLFVPPLMVLITCNLVFKQIAYSFPLH